MRIGKGLSSTLIMTFICQNVAFCLSEESCTLRLPVNGSLRVKRAIEEQSGIVEGKKTSEMLVNETFQREDYININALRQLFHSIAEDIGLRPENIKPVLTGSSVYLADKDGFVKPILIGDLDIFWEIPEGLDVEKFTQIRKEFAERLQDALKIKFEYVYLTDKTNMFTIEFHLSKISITDLAVPDVVGRTLDEIRYIFDTPLEELQLEMIQKDYTKGIKRCFMFVYYLRDFVKEKDKFEEFKNEYEAIFILRYRKPGQIIRNLLQEMFNFIQEVKQDDPEIIEKNEAKLRDKIRINLAIIPSIYESRINIGDINSIDKNRSQL